jgi:hypothetical protein
MAKLFLHRNSSVEKNVIVFISLVISFFGVIAGWILFGWRFHQFLFGADGIIALWPMFSQPGGYSTDVMGGVLVDSIYSKPLLFNLLRGWGVDTIPSLNWTLIALQSLFCFLLTEAALPQGSIPSGKRILYSVYGVAFFGFMPLLGWRISRGHLNLYQGAILVAAGFAIYELLRQKRLNTWHASAFGLLVLNALQPAAAQILTYGVVFALPWLIVLAVQHRRAMTATVFLALGAAALCTPWLGPALESLQSGDVLRGVPHDHVVFSYITTVLGDLKQSLFWNFRLLKPTREDFYFHEAYYSAGPLVPMILLFYCREKKWRLLIASLISLGMMVGFAMHLEPFCKILMTVFPPLQLFRVPNRVLMIGILVMTFFGVQKIFEIVHHQPLKRIYSGTFFAAVVVWSVLLPSTVQELIAWIACFLFVFLANHPRFINGGWIRLALLACSSLFAFQTTLYLPLSDLRADQAQLDQVHRSLQSDFPDLFAPLVRVQVPMNTAQLIGLSSIDGYWFPLTAFERLVAATEGHEKVDATRMNYDIHRNHPGFDILKDLYNIQGFLENNQGQLHIQRLSQGPAIWSSSEQKTFSSYRDLVDQLRKTDRFRTQWRVDGPEVSSPRCGDVHFSQLQRANDKLMFHVDSPASCPVTLSTNFTRQMSAFDQTHHLPIPPYLADGALLGLTVPEGASDIEVHLFPTLPFWVFGLVGLGFMIYLWFARKLVAWI